MTAGGSSGDGDGRGADGAGGGEGGAGVAGGTLSPRLVVLAGRKGKPSLLPFVAVLLVLGLLGMLALLFLNTELNKGAFTIKQQKATASKLTQEAQEIQQSLAGLDGPGALAAKASELGMVPNGNPAFLAPNGSVLGSPSAAAPTPTTPPTPAGEVPGAAVAPGAAQPPAGPPSTTAAEPSPSSSPSSPPPTPTGAGR